MRKHEGTADPIVTDIVSFRRATVNEEDVKSICDIIFDNLALNIL